MGYFKRLAGEFLGSALLLCAVVGSGIFAEELTQDAALRVLINAISIGLALAVLIWWFSPISGAHFNPVVTAASVIRGESKPLPAIGYALAQATGAVSGAVASNLMFGLPAVTVSSFDRLTLGTFASEVLATAALITLVVTLSSRGQGRLAPLVIGAWITSAIFFTSSTTFANPAVTLARVFTDSMTGINPGSALGFLLAQAIGLPVGTLITKFFREASTE
ncbi:MAG: aquaporin [Micrococcales bacterium]